MSRPPDSTSSDVRVFASSAGASERRADCRRPQTDPVGVPRDVAPAGRPGRAPTRAPGRAHGRRGAARAGRSTATRTRLLGAAGDAANRVRGRPGPRHRKAESEQRQVTRHETAVCRGGTARARPARGAGCLPRPGGAPQSDPRKRTIAACTRCRGAPVSAGVTSPVLVGEHHGLHAVAGSELGQDVADARTRRRTAPPARSARRQRASSRTPASRCASRTRTSRKSRADAPAIHSMVAP